MGTGNRLLERAGLITGVVLAVSLAVAIWPLAHFLPPPSPAEPSSFYADYYRTNTLGIRLAALLLTLGGTLYAPFFGSLAVLTRRMEGQAGWCTPTLLLSSAVASATFFLSGLLFGVAAFRPERPVEMLSALNDLAWFELVLPALPATIQCFALGCAVLGDARTMPIMPRWVGFANLWFGILFMPGCAIMLFKTGLLAWNGLLAFWVPAFAFVGWLVLLFVYGWRATARDVAA